MKHSQTKTMKLRKRNSEIHVHTTEILTIDQNLSTVNKIIKKFRGHNDTD